jgi:hypothetical protein
MNELEYIGARLMSLCDFEIPCYLSKSLLKANGITRMNPEDANFRQLFSNLVCVFDRKLGFAT